LAVIKRSTTTEEGRKKIREPKQNRQEKNIASSEKKVGKDKYRKN